MAKIEWYVVTTKNPSDLQLNDIQKLISQKYGGLTIIKNCLGLWLDGEKIDSDKVEIWFTFGEIDARFNKEIAECLKVVCKQKSQLYTENSNPFFI